MSSSIIYGYSHAGEMSWLIFVDHDDSAEFQLASATEIAATKYYFNVNSYFNNKVGLFLIIFSVVMFIFCMFRFLI